MGRISCAAGLLTGIINDTNFLVIYLSMVIVFFLLGLLLGLTIHTRRKITKETRPADTTDPLNKARQPYIPGQDSRGKTDNQISPANNQRQHSRHRHHRHSSIHIQ